MKQKRSTRTALVSAVISLLLCVSMLLGTTFAWFTDNVVSTGNVIQTGDLKIDLLAYDAVTADYVSVKDTSAPVFSGTNWEPGFSDAALLKIENKGSLALKWDLNVVPAAGYVPAAAVNLANVIDVYVLPDATAEPASFEEVKTNYTRLGTLAELLAATEATDDGILLPVDADPLNYDLAVNAEYAIASCTLGIVLHMQETAGNEYQAQTMAGFDLKLNANQLAYEAE